MLAASVNGYYKLSTCILSSRHADVMKKIIEMVAEGGGDLGVHMYPSYYKIYHIMRQPSSCH